VAALNRASKAFVGPGNKHDHYSEPVKAPVEWWKEVATKAVRDVLVWGGGGEVLIDGIQAFGGHIIQGFAQANASILLDNGVAQRPLDEKIPDEANEANEADEANEAVKGGIENLNDAAGEIVRTTSQEIDGAVNSAVEGSAEEVIGNDKSASHEANDPVKVANQKREDAPTQNTLENPSKPSKIAKVSRATLVITPHEAHEEMIMDYILMISKKGDGAKEIENWMTKTLRG
jgi:hypothetical protein